MITWSHDQSIKRLNGWWPFAINLHLVNFASHSPRGSGDISFFISHVTSCGHVTKRSSLPSVVATHLLEVKIWPILIFNVKTRIHMIILLQSVTIQIHRLVWHISYYKASKSSFITKCDRLLLQSVSDIKKCDRLLLQSASGITKCDSYYKVRRNRGTACEFVRFSFLSSQESNTLILKCSYSKARSKVGHIFFGL